MKAEKEIRERIAFLNNLLGKYDKSINKKRKINSANIDKVEELEQMYYECLVEIASLKWVLGEEQ